MNKISTIMIIALCYAANAAAQSVHVFTLSPNTQKEMPAQMRKQLDMKIQQALIRAGALASDSSGVFQVQSQLILNSATPKDIDTQGITTARGQLYLTIVNRRDGSKYHQATKDVHASVMGDIAQAYLHIIKRLSITDPLWAKFVANGRKKITDYYACNAQTIIEKAETYYKNQQYRECIDYLSTIPTTVSFHTQIKTLNTLCSKAMKEAEQSE